MLPCRSLAQLAPGLRARHLELMGPPVLAAVPGGRHDDQALPQRPHRGLVLVAEALLDDVGHPPGGVQVQPLVIEQLRPMLLGSVLLGSILPEAVLPGPVLPGPVLPGPVLQEPLQLGIECHPGASSA